jgi:hypothetical protein
LLEAGKSKSAAYEEAIARMQAELADQNKTIEQVKTSLKASKQENRLLQEHHAQERDEFQRRRCA